MIRVRDLVKTFGTKTVVDGVSFDVHEGELFGFLGPNGAGKSTTIKMLCTILKQNAGSAWINGFDTQRQPDKVRNSIGIIFQDPSLDLQLSVRENLWFHGKLYHVPGRELKTRMTDVLRLVEMEDRLNQEVRTLSGGLKRRLEIARSMLHRPRVLFLDEPTTGLDPQARRHVWEFLNTLRQQHGMTIFLTTHYMDEAAFCDHVCIMDHGHIIATGTPLELARAHAPEADPATVSLDDVFITLTGRELRDEDASGRDKLRDRARMRKRV